VCMCAGSPRGAEIRKEAQTHYQPFPSALVLLLNGQLTEAAEVAHVGGGLHNLLNSIPPPEGQGFTGLWPWGLRQD
jgi:hypothetical protein